MGETLRMKQALGRGAAKARARLDARVKTLSPSELEAFARARGVAVATRPAKTDAKKPPRRVPASAAPSRWIV